MNYDFFCDRQSFSTLVKSERRKTFVFRRLTDSGRSLEIRPHFFKIFGILFFLVFICFLTDYPNRRNVNFCLFLKNKITKTLLIFLLNISSPSYFHMIFPKMRSFLRITEDTHISITSTLFPQW